MRNLKFIKPNVNNKDFKAACQSTDYVKKAMLETELKRTKSKIKKAVIKCKLTKLNNRIEEFLYQMFEGLDGP